MDTYLALIVPAMVSVFGIFLFRQAILGVPDDLIEAVRNVHPIAQREYASVEQEIQRVHVIVKRLLKINAVGQHLIDVRDHYRARLE